MPLEKTKPNISIDAIRVFDMAEKIRRLDLGQICVSTQIVTLFTQKAIPKLPMVLTMQMLQMRLFIRLFLSQSPLLII
jgi:hypothetical protein